MNDKHLTIHFLLILLFYYKKKSMLHSFSSTYGQNMIPYGQSLLSKQWFFVLCFCLNKYGTTIYCFHSKILPYGLIFHPQVEENECSILLLLIIHEVFQNHFFCHSSQWPESKKKLFLQFLLSKMIFFKKIGCIQFFSSTCGQNMSLYR